MRIDRRPELAHGQKKRVREGGSGNGGTSVRRSTGVMNLPNGIPKNGRGKGSWSADAMRIDPSGCMFIANNGSTDGVRGILRDQPRDVSDVDQRNASGEPVYIHSNRGCYLAVALVVEMVMVKRRAYRKLDNRLACRIRR